MLASLSLKCPFSYFSILVLKTQVQMPPPPPWGHHLFPQCPVLNLPSQHSGFPQNWNLPKGIPSASYPEPTPHPQQYFPAQTVPDEPRSHSPQPWGRRDQGTPTVCWNHEVKAPQPLSASHRSSHILSIQWNWAPPGMPPLLQSQGPSSSQKAPFLVTSDPRVATSE